jgi:anti-sigma regulatory factor (Ser/Thr protein kinase)
MPKAKISFKLSNNLSELNTLNKKIDAFGIQIGLTTKVKFEINLVLEEIFTNIVSYGYRDEKEHWITVTISSENDAITIRIEDDGIPFNPLESEKPDLKCPVGERPIGGLGIHLVKHYTKYCAYERCRNKNILILRKTILPDMS